MRSTTNAILPCQPSNPTIRVFSSPKLSHLIGEEDPETERNRQEEVFDWDARRADGPRETGNVEEDENDYQGEKNGREEI